MKVVNRNSLTTPAIVQQLFVERDILTFAENPFITSMACSFETDEHLAFVMDYVQGNENYYYSYCPLYLHYTATLQMWHTLYVYSHGSFCPRRSQLWDPALSLETFSTGHGPIVYSRNSRGYRVPPRPWYCARRPETRKVGPRLVPLSQNLARLLFLRFAFWFDLFFQLHLSFVLQVGQANNLLLASFVACWSAPRVTSNWQILDYPRSVRWTWQQSVIEDPYLI